MKDIILGGGANTTHFFWSLEFQSFRGRCGERTPSKKESHLRTTCAMQQSTRYLLLCANSKCLPCAHDKTNIADHWVTAEISLKFRPEKFRII
jgi:hypothetical protein